MLLNNTYNLLFKNLFRLKGRCARTEYVTRLLLTTLVCIIWTYTVDKCTDNNLFTVVYVVGMAIFMSVLIYQYFPLSIRRLHDLNESGWYVFLTFVPFCQFFILWLMFKEGTPGPNRYGEPPED